MSQLRTTIYDIGQVLSYMRCCIMISMLQRNINLRVVAVQPNTAFHKVLRLLIHSHLQGSMEKSHNSKLSLKQSPFLKSNVVKFRKLYSVERYIYSLRHFEFSVSPQNDVHLTLERMPLSLRSK